ncbi:MAG: hypothetical protein ACU84Q_03680 [Gammaproteobacteria bacterium]
MNTHRRKFLVSSFALGLSTCLLSYRSFAKSSPAIAALDKSALIYLTPILANGNESACHGEVWFVHHDGEIYVVTQTDAWRAQAIRKGLATAAIWIGEFGVWKRAKNKFRSAPYLRIKGSLETDSAVHAAVLEKFGAKYANEWSSWGPRFRDGLAEGSRVMLRYHPVT